MCVCMCVCVYVCVSDNNIYQRSHTSSIHVLAVALQGRKLPARADQSAVRLHRRHHDDGDRMWLARMSVGARTGRRSALQSDVLLLPVGRRQADAKSVSPIRDDLRQEDQSLERHHRLQRPGRTDNDVTHDVTVVTGRDQSVLWQR